MRRASTLSKKFVPFCFQTFYLVVISNYFEFQDLTLRYNINKPEQRYLKIDSVVF